MARGRAVILGLSIPIYAILGYLTMVLSVHGPEILVPLGPIYFLGATSAAVVGYRKFRGSGGTVRYLGVCAALALLAPLLVFIVTN